MSIASELSCDVATAILSRRGEEAGALEGDLAVIVLEVHSILRQLTEEARRIRRSQLIAMTAQASPPADGDTPSFGH